MAFDWEHVEAIRAEQNSARARRDINTLPTDETSERIYNSPAGIDAKVPKLDHWEQMIQKVRTQLIDYIISHGLVQGFEYDGIDEPIKNGKIVLTADMLKRVTDRFGYFREKETKKFIEAYLPEHFYVSDENYVHTDNNYTDTEKDKLSGVADGAEVNKVISILFNGVETVDPETRVATITITPADIKAWYEQNPDTNVFTDAEKAKLESIDINALSNKVEDITLDGETVVKNKVAVLTAKKIKDSYESNPDTNAFTDADKVLVEQVTPEIQKGVNQHEKRLDDLEKSQTVQDSEIADIKDSISELGDEVNSVAGRVTNLESSQKVQDGKIDTLEKWKSTTDASIDSLKEKNTEQDNEISELKNKDTKQDGRLDALETWKGTTDASISALEEKNTTQDDEILALKKKETVQDADILQLKEDVKNAGKVDDVTVGGVSVVENKIAKIPEIPDTNDLVPYSGATKDVNIGNNSLSIALAKELDADTALTAKINTGKFLLNEANEQTATSGIKVVAEKVHVVNETPITDNATFAVVPGNITMGITANTGETTPSYVTRLNQNGFTIANQQDAKKAINITPEAISGLEIPTLDSQAANKKYVDDKVSSIGNRSFLYTEAFHLPDIPAGGTIVLSKDVDYTGNDVLGIVPYSGNINIVVVPTFWHTTTGYTKLTVRVTNIGDEAIGEGYGCKVNVTLRQKTK